MSQTSKTAWWIVGIVIVVVIVISVSKGGANNSGPIKIGIIAPLTGDAAGYGEPARNVFQMAANEINSSGGINGRSVQLVIEDSKCDGKDGASAAQKLISIDKVQVIIGDVCSGATLGELPVTEGARVALFSAGASSPDLTGKSPYFSRDYPSDASQGMVLADEAARLGYKKVVFAQEQTDYALGLYNTFKAEFAKSGGQTTEEQLPSDAPDTRSILLKLQADKPDMLFIDTQTTALSGRILTQLENLGWKVPIFMNDVSIGTPQLLLDNKGILEGAIGAEFKVSDSTKFTNLLSTYKSTYGIDMAYESYGQTEYDALYLVRDAIAAVGYDGVKIAQWLRTVKGWPGASGSVTIDPMTGDRIGGHSLEIVKNGVSQPYTVATSTPQ